MNQHDERRSADRIVGILLAVASGLTVFTMAHHPSGAHGAGALGAVVHGTMIVLVVTILFGLVHFALCRGIRRPLVLVGLVTYSIGAVANVAAAMINGFISPAIAGHRDRLEAPHDLLLLCWESNQALARLAVFAGGAAFLLWSIDLVVRDKGANRIIGFIGVLAGIVPALGLLGGRTMDVPTAFAIYATHALWILLIGVRLSMRKL